MKLDFNEIKVERSAAFQSQSFDIGDKRIILEILRGKMYSNPIQTIAQEISTNARDAHTEVGKSDVPIEIKLPNKLDPSFWIHDFGPGITPDRMGSIFIQYGRSTKRDDNTQQGAYGLGSKSPFSYSDTFTIISITPENDKLIRREYLAHIDESGLGQMSCVKEEETTDPQGTAIVLYPKPSDWASFTQHVIRATVHWPIRPTIIGDPEFAWPEYKVSYKGEDWEIHDNSPIESVPYALISGIPYILNLRHLYPGGNALIQYIPFRIHFKIGEIPVTANREDIDYQSHVITYVKNRIDKAVKEFQDQLSAELVNAKTLRAAIIMWQELKRKVYKDFLTNAVWNSITLRDFELIKLEGRGCKVTHFRRADSVAYGCRKSSDSSSLNIGSQYLIVEDDLKVKGIQKARLSTLFDRFPHITYIQVVDFTKKTEKIKMSSGDYITQVSVVDDTEIEKRKKEVEECAHWSSLEPVKFSSVPRKKIIFVESDDSTKKRYKIIKVKKFVITSEHSYDWAEADSAILADKKPKLYVVVSNKSIQWRDNGGKIQLRDLYNILTVIKKMRAIVRPTETEEITIYGVVPSELPKLEDNCSPFYQYAETIVQDYKKTLPEQYGSDFALARRFHGYAGTVLSSPAVIDSLHDTSLIREYILESNKVNAAAALVGLYNDVSHYFGQTTLSPKNQQNPLKDLYDKVTEKYPLIHSLNNYYGNVEMTNDVILYLKIKDNVITSPETGQTNSI